jgi:hypothetical protein
MNFVPSIRNARRPRSRFHRDNFRGFSREHILLFVADPMSRLSVILAPTLLAGVYNERAEQSLEATPTLRRELHRFLALVKHVVAFTTSDMEPEQETATARPGPSPAAPINSRHALIERAAR